MSLTLGDNFSYQGAKPLDARLKYETVAAMKAVADATMYDGCLAYCAGTDKTYQWKSTNTVDETLGKWREFQSGGGGGTTYEAGDGIDISDDTISIDPMPAEDMSEVIDEIPSGGSLAVAGYVPLATIISFFGETPPKFFLACDGSTYNKTDYPELANHLLSLTTHSQYEVDGDSTKFKVPDLRGEFIRGAGTNSHTDQGSGADVGVHQDATAIPAIAIWNNSGIGLLSPYNENGNLVNDDSNYGSSATNKYWKKVNVSSTARSSGQDMRTIRPTNTSVMFCIAYKDIYSNPMNDYSTTEKVVGTWINGKPIYQKTIDVGALPNATAKNVAHNISNLDKVINIIAMAYGSGQHMPINFPAMDNVVNSNNVRIMGTNININSGINRSGLSGYVTLQYTKTTD